MIILSRLLYNNIDDLHKIIYISNIYKSYYKLRKTYSVYHTKQYYDYTVRIKQRNVYLKIQVLYDDKIVRMPLYLCVKNDINDINNKIEKIIYLIIKNRYDMIRVYNTIN